MKKLFKKAFGRKESLDAELYHEHKEDLTPRKATEEELNQIQFRITEMKQKAQLEEKELQVATERAKQKQLLNDILNEEQLPLNPDAPDYIMDDEERAKKEATDIVSGILSDVSDEKEEISTKQSTTDTLEEPNEPELEINEDHQEPEIDIEEVAEIEDETVSELVEPELEIEENISSDDNSIDIEEVDEEEIVSEAEDELVEPELEIEEDITFEEESIDIEEVAAETEDDTVLEIEDESVEPELEIEEDITFEEESIEFEEVAEEIEDDIVLEIEDESVEPELEIEEDVTFEDESMDIEEVAAETEDDIVLEIEDESVEPELEIEEDITFEEESIDVEEVNVEVEEDIVLEIEEESVEPLSKRPILIDIEPEPDTNKTSFDKSLLNNLFQMAESNFSEGLEPAVKEIKSLLNKIEEDQSIHSPLKLYLHVVEQINEADQFKHYLEKIASVTNESQFFSSEESLLSLTNQLAHIRKMIHDTLNPVKRKAMSANEIQSNSNKSLIQERIKPISKRKIVKVVKKKPVAQ